jgi:uncharacterized small protein (DUF1192 family)
MTSPVAVSPDVAEAVEEGGPIMDIDDLEPRKQKPAPKNLDVMSIEALKEYIGELEAEIARVRQAIVGKEKARAGADGFFKR